MQLYKSLVRLHLEYAVQAWIPYKQKHVDQTEKVQRLSTKMTRDLASLPYDQRKNLLSLEMRRQRVDLVEVYKIIHGLEDLQSDLLFKTNLVRTRGHHIRLVKNHVHLNARKYLFFSKK